MRISIFFIFFVTLSICGQTFYSGNTFISQLPSYKQILNLPVYTNSTPIQIFSSQQHLTILENQPFNQIREFLGINISYSKQIGFSSEWSAQTRSRIQFDEIMGHITQVQISKQNSPILCEPTSPQIIYKNMSTFTLQSQHIIHSPKIIISYSELLYEEMILDLWKYPKRQNQKSENKIFMIMSNGNLVVATPTTKNNNKPSEDYSNHLTQYQINKIKVSKQLRYAQFNTQRFQKERKIYIFSDSVQIQIIFKQNLHEKDSSQQFDINFFKIQSNTSYHSVLGFSWLSLKSEDPFLGLMRKQQFEIYSYDSQSKSYKLIQNSTIGAKQIKQLFKIQESNVISAVLQINFMQFIFIQDFKMILLLQHNFGLFFLEQKSDGKYKLRQLISATNFCDNMQLLQLKQNPTNLIRRILYMNCQNILIKYFISYQTKKIEKQSVNMMTLNVPTGPIEMISSSIGDLIFVKGQASMAAFNSWKYPRLINQPNIKFDNIFIFDSEYVSILENQIIVGNYELEHEKIVCRKNPEYKQKKFNNQMITQQNSKNDNLINSTNSISSTQLFMEYIASCQPQVLSLHFYNISTQNKFSYCRYKKHYTHVSLTLALPQNKNSQESENLQKWLIIIFSFVIIALFVGISIWIIQKHKINRIIQEQGLPIGSQDLDQQEYISKNHDNKK